MTASSIDLVSEALALMRVTGSLLFVENYAPPWGVLLPEQGVIGQLLGAPPTTRVVAFHYVFHGHMDCAAADGQQFALHAGEMLVCFGGMAHHLFQGHPRRSATFESHLGAARGRFQPAGVPEAKGTALICGVFLLRDTHLNPLFGALPAFLQVPRPVAPAAGLALPIPDLLTRELSQPGYGSDYAVQRLLELLCIEAIRFHLHHHPALAPGWFRGLRDPLLGKALTRFHQTPGAAWSVARLAQEANLSPSRFAARFREAFGESVMAYVTQWRLNIARHLLHTTEQSVAAIAYQVGYDNAPAFSRVFSRYMGCSPALWRAAQGHTPPSGG